MTSILDRNLTIASPSDRFSDNEIRVDGREKVSGQAQYTSDHALPGMLWAAFTASPVAHATIVSIDTSAARAMPGVHAVLTGRDIGDRFFGRRLCDWPVLSIDRVRFIGEYVAAVAADSPEIAAAAAAAIEVEYDELPTLFDTSIALTDAAPVLHDDPDKYTFMFPKRPKHAHKNIQGHTLLTVGDVKAGMARADRVFESTFTTPRYHGGYLEPRSTLVWIDAAETVHVMSTNKSPFALRESLSVTTGVPKEKIVVVPAYIGGDFGAKGLSIEEFPCYYLAKATGRPIKCVRDYVDDIRSTTVRHASTVTVRTGVMNDGTLVAQDVDVVFDGGAYAAGKVIPNILPGVEPRLPYRLPSFRMERTAVYTNTVPGGFIRVPGDVQIIFGMESAMDIIAAELGIDPIVLRRKNAVVSGDAGIDGTPFLEARGVEVLDILERESSWNTPLPPGRGRGVSLTVRHIGGGKTSCQLLPQASGHIDVRTGTTEQGMGILTVLQRIIAAEFGIARELVRPARGGTDVAAFDPGVGASRTTHISGQAALAACVELRRDLENAASAFANAPPGTLTLRDGAFAARDGATTVSWNDAVGELLRANGGAVTITGTYDGDHTHGEPEHNDFCGYAIAVTVDRETGAFTIDDVLMAADVGTIINPIAHRGQIDGGFIFGLGSALTEELIVDEGRITNLSFADYKLPTTMDIPPFRVILIEDKTGPGPFGARMVGELNLSGIGPALASAVEQACGARIDTMPITAERIYAALHPAD